LGAVVGDTPHGMTDAPDPAQALNHWIADEAPDYVVLPLGGYRAVHRAEHWTLFAHQVEGSPKVVVLVADTGAVPRVGHWTAMSFAACDAAEFDPSVPLGYDIKVWSDRDGRVSTRRLMERQDCYGARVMRVETKLFVQDPTGTAFEPEYLLTTYDPDVPLPGSARLTDFVDGERRRSSNHPPVSSVGRGSAATSTCAPTATDAPT
jgi:hypothetical protein